MFFSKTLTGLIVAGVFTVTGALGGVRAEAPLVQIHDGVEVSPSTVYSANSGSTVHTDMWTVGIHPEIVSLARSLKYDPALMYQYVRDNIETLPMFGLKKGALGALIDKNGTPLDQAALLVELLKAADQETPSDSDFSTTNFAPKFRFIRSDITPSDMEDWFGLSDANAVCRLLKASGTPYSIVKNGTTTSSCSSVSSGSYTEAQILHVVVEATVGGSTVAFDPAYKVQNNFDARSNLGSDLSFNFSNFQSAANFTTGSTNGVPYVSGNVKSAVETQLQTYATALVTKLKQDTKHGGPEDAYKLSMVDVVGGVEIAEAEDQESIPGSWPTLSGLANYGQSFGSTGLSAVPNNYRTKITLTHNGSSFTAYMDELYGRRQWLWNDSGTVNFIVGNRILWSTTYSSSSGFDIALDQPYGGSSNTYGDRTQTFTNPFTVGNVAALVLSAGDSGIGQLGRYNDDEWQALGVDESLAIEVPTTVSMGPNAGKNTQAVRGQIGLATSFLVQQAMLRELAEGLTDSRIMIHDVVGIVAGNDGSSVDPQLDIRTQLSVVTETNSTSNQKAAIWTVTSAMSAIEGAVIDQVQDIERSQAPGRSGVAAVAQALVAGEKLYNVSTNNFSSIQSSLTNYSSSRLTSMSTLNATERMIVPQNGNITSGGITNSAYLIVDDATGGVGHLVHNGAYAVGSPIKGAHGAKVEYDAVNSAYTASLDAVVGLSPEYVPQYAQAGFASTDLVTGSGGFPYSLSYTRYYKGGGDWTHNFDISANFSGSGLIALGYRSPSEAAEAISAIYATYQALKSCIAATGSSHCDEAERAAVSAVSMNWLQNKLVDNVFSVTQGMSSTSYGKLADGTYYTQAGGMSGVSVSGTGAGMTVTVTLPNGSELEFDAEDSSARSFLPSKWSWPHYDQAIGFDYTTTPGSVIVSNGFSRRLTIAKTYNTHPFTKKLQYTEITVTDENGNVAFLDYTSSAWVATKTVGSTTSVIMTYDKESLQAGEILGVSSNEINDKVTYTYNDLGKIIKRSVKNTGNFNIYSNSWRSETVAPNGGSSISIGDPYGRFALSIDALGRETRREFDRLGRVVYSTTIASSATRLADISNSDDFIYSTYDYDKYNNIISVTAHSKPNGGSRETLTTTYTYHGTSKYRQVASVTNPLNKTTTYDYFSSGNGKGRIKSVTTPSVEVHGASNQSLTTNYTYNNKGQVLTITAPDGTVTSTTYTSGLPTTVTLDSGGLALTSTFTYTDEGDVATITDHRNNVTTLTYDDFRRQETSSGPEGTYSYVTYDGDGRPVAVSNRLTVGSTTTDYSVSRTFDAVGRLRSITDNNNNTTSIAYSITHNFLDITGPDSVKTRRHFDILGRLKNEVTAFGTSDSIMEKIAYNPDGTVNYVEDGRSTKTYYEYDHWNRVTKTDYFAGSDETINTYDVLGRPTQMTTRAGDTVTIVYDAIGRVKSRTINSNITYAYTYDKMSRVKKVTHTKGSTSQTVTYSYDALGRQTAETGAFGYTMGTSYNDTAGSYSLSYNGAYTVHYSTDALGRVDKIRENSSTGTLIADYAYDTLSRVTELAFGNGTEQTFGYDTDTGWLDSVTLDANGDGDTNDTGEVAFGYVRNQYGKIIGETVSNTDYVYGPSTTPGSKSYAANTINQYTAAGSAAPTYDSAGNLTFDGTYTYTWDEENRLTQVKQGAATKGTYKYDANGRRSEKVVSSTTTRYLWGGWTNYAEFNGSNVLQRSYVYGPGIDEPIMVKEANGTKRYVHRDGKGTVVGITNASRTVTNIFTMDVWGDGADASVSPYKFTSRRIDDETGNYYYRNRYYHADQGRFMSADPLGYADGHNMYAYAGNDPVNFRDPMGTIKCTGSHIETENCKGSASPLVCSGNCAALSAESSKDATRDSNNEDGISGENTQLRNSEPPRAGQSNAWYGEEFVISESRVENDISIWQFDWFYQTQQNIRYLRLFDDPIRDVPYLVRNALKNMVDDARAMSGEVDEDHTLLYLVSGARAIWGAGRALYLGAAKIWKDLSFDGPDKGFLQYQNGRIFGVRWRKSVWGVRLDFHPLPGSNGHSVLHINFGPPGRGEAAHWIIDPDF